MRLVLAMLLGGSFYLVSATAHSQQNPDGIIPLHGLGDPLPLLLRDEVVLQELRVDAKQRGALRDLGNRLDPIFWTKRNHSSEQFQAAWEESIRIARTEAEKILSPTQLKRIKEIRLRVRGAHAVVEDELAEVLELSLARKKMIEEILTKTSSQIAELHGKANAGEPIGPLEQERTRVLELQQRQILQKLTDQQRTRWVNQLGQSFDLSKLGKVDFLAPELISTDNDWLNGNAAALYSSRPVTVIHFFANGCINCIRNYEHYKGWDQTFRDQGVVIVGIHTPETKAEHDRPRLEQKVSEAEFQFPILIDNEKKNWNDWGNTMWPSVYLVDQQGRVRYWWYGELNWQGATGEQQLRARITELLVEAKENAKVNTVSQ